MKRLRCSRVLFFAVFAVLLNGEGAHAENISNYSGCDVCEGAVHLDGGETKALLGTRGRELVSALQSDGLKHIRIDVDGVLKSSRDPDATEGFEIIVYGSMHSIILKSLLDGSLIQFITDKGNELLVGAQDNWQPHLYIQSADGEAIHLEDTVETGWKKFSESAIYDWVLSGRGQAAFEARLREKICQALVLLR